MINLLVRGGNTLFCQMLSLFTIINLCMVLENNHGKFSHSLKNMENKILNLNLTVLPNLICIHIAVSSHIGLYPSPSLMLYYLPCVCVPPYLFIYFASLSHVGLYPSLCESQILYYFMFACIRPYLHFN